MNMDWIEAVIWSFGDKYQNPQRWSIWNRNENSRGRTNSASSISINIKIPLFIFWIYFIVKYF